MIDPILIERGQDLIEQGRSVSDEAVANRAKAVSVLQKAAEFMQTDNPPPSDAASIRRAIELGAGRLGLTLADYEALVRNDAELLAFEKSVIESVVTAR